MPFLSLGRKKEKEMPLKGLPPIPELPDYKELPATKDLPTLPPIPELPPAKDIPTLPPLPKMPPSHTGIAHRDDLGLSTAAPLPPTKGWKEKTKTVEQKEPSPSLPELEEPTLMKGIKPVATPKPVAEILPRPVIHYPKPEKKEFPSIEELTREVKESEVKHEEPKEKLEEIPEKLPEIGETIEEPEEVLAPKKAAYIRISQYQDLLKSLIGMKKTIRFADAMLHSMEHLKNLEDAEFEKWRATLEDIERKLIYVDKVLFEGD